MKWSKAIGALSVLLLLPLATYAATSQDAARAHFDEGVELNKQQRYDEALKKFTMAVHSDLENHKYHQALFMTYLALRRGIQAVDVYTTMAGEHPKSPAVHYWLGRLHLQRQSLDDAVREFELAADLAPRDEHAWISLGHTYYRQGNDEQAMTAYKKANALVPKVAVVHAGLGSVYFKRKEYAKAQRELEEALRLDPSLMEARVKLSLAYEQRGHLSKAVKEWHRILEDDPNETVVRERLARTYFETGQLADAVREYSLLSQLRQASPDVFLALGEAQVLLAASLTDPSEKAQLRGLAIEAFQRTLELDPGNENAKRYLAGLTPGKAPSVPVQ